MVRGGAPCLALATGPASSGKTSGWVAAVAEEGIRHEELEGHECTSEALRQISAKLKARGVAESAGLGPPKAKLLVVEGADSADCRVDNLLRVWKFVIQTRAKNDYY